MSSKGRFLAFSILFCALAANAADSFLTCTVSGTPTTVRAEGLTERMGDIAIRCTGGTPGTTVTGSLFVFLSVPITNRVSSSGVVDAVITVDTGIGPATSAGAIAMLSGTGIGFTGFNVTVPPSGALTFSISNLRGAVAQQGVASTAPITAMFAVIADQLHLLQTSTVVGVPQRALAASTAAAAISGCTGSPVPAALSMSNMIMAGTRAFTIRITAGFSGAFEKRAAGTDSGVRVIVNYTGIRSDVRLFVPDVIAGSDAAQPTSGGDLGLSASGGAYSPGGTGSLLLARVDGADSNGAGGAPVYTPGAPGSGTVIFDSASEVQLTGGAGQVVYEVMDATASGNFNESAQLPTFVGLAPTGDLSPLGSENITLGPVSTVARATETDPIPRFVAAAPPSDCVLLGDCASFPKLVVNAPSLTFTASASSRDQGTWFFVQNAGGGALSWSATIVYTTGSGWARVQTDGWGNVWVTVSPKNLAPGVYEATLTIDAGANAGSQTLPIKLTVTPPPSAVRIDGIAHAATYAVGPLAPGSLAMLSGAGLSGNAVAVTFDSISVRLLYISATQINLLIPPELGLRASAQVIAVVDGIASTPFTVSLTPINPGIFPTGVLNQDLSVNSAPNPAVIGSVAVIFATGLPSQAGAIVAKINGREITALDYAGPAPTLPGVEQVNMRIPADLTPMTTDIVVCGVDSTNGLRVCSPAARITLRQ
jgi:uncharacterized protein (TIGR03437 family)